VRCVAGGRIVLSCSVSFSEQPANSAAIDREPTGENLAELHDGGCSYPTDALKGAHVQAVA
jgi:hypothetical protein